LEATDRQPDLSWTNLLRADRPGLSTPEQYAFHRGLDFLLGLLLITNFMRSTGIFIGESGALSFSVSGPLITQPYIEGLLKALYGPEAVGEAAKGGVPT
jgi:hypothetical protein